MSTTLSPTQALVIGRLSYADIFTPKEFKKGDGKPRYKTLVLIPKNTEQGRADFAAIQRASAAAKEEKWGNKIPKITSDKLCLTDGDGEKGTEDTKGHWILSASETEAPQVLDRDGVTELSERDGKIYSGCFARVLVNLWGQDNDWGVRVNANLQAVQHVAHGPAFGRGRVSAREVFGSLEDVELGDIGGISGSAASDDDDAGAALI